MKTYVQKLIGFFRKIFRDWGGCMSFINCCGSRHSVKVFKMKDTQGFLAVFVSILQKCPICGGFIIEMRRYTVFGQLMLVRKSGAKARKLFTKIRSNLCNIADYERSSGTISTLNYNEFGKIKKCRSNLSRLSIGKFESLTLSFASSGIFRCSYV